MFKSLKASLKSKSDAMSKIQESLIEKNSVQGAMTVHQTSTSLSNTKEKLSNN